MGYYPTMKFASGFEILEYCQMMADRSGFYDRCLFHTTVKETRWDEAAGRWIVQTDRGDKMRAHFVVLANGILTTPKLARIEGMETFEGESFHTSRWNYHIDLTDKRVGIIGTGATAVQVIPEIAKVVKQLHVFQRTPSTIDVRDQRRDRGLVEGARMGEGAARALCHDLAWAQCATGERRLPFGQGHGVQGTQDIRARVDP
jgi:cyclohexanone monooxygenase